MDDMVYEQKKIEEWRWFCGNEDRESWI